MIRSMTEPARGDAPASTDESLEYRWYLDFLFVEAGWSKRRDLTDPLVDALAGTATWELANLYGHDFEDATARGTLTAVKKQLASGKARHRFVHHAASPARYVDDTDAFIELEVTPRYLSIMCMVRREPLARLRSRALDDFFALARGLHQAWAGNAHVTKGAAWTTSKRNDPPGPRSGSWEMRAIADALEPARPPTREGDPLLLAAQAIAAAAVPEAATREDFRGLVLLRWVDDPSDGPAANAAATQHERWLVDVIETAAT